MNFVLRRAGYFLSAIALAATVPCAWAQGGYPNRPIRIIVPWPAGGSVDVATRVVAEKLSVSLGQPVMVDNRAGASGNIGATAGAKAVPDGYTLLVATTPMLINQSLYGGLPFDPAKSFTAVSLLVNVNYVLVANPTVANSVKELVVQAKARPGQISYASSGPGTQLHLHGEAFKQKAGIDIVHVPYKGAPPALADMIGGHVQMMFPGFPVVQPLLKTGQLKALAVVGKRRLALLPDVPTMAEAGFPGMDSVEWYGVVAPAGTPRDIVARLNSEIVKTLNMPDVHTLLASKGYEPASSTPEQFSALIKSEQVSWASFVKQMNRRPDN
ncbi:tripartite tricarboxylate transporter substrate binding protein [Polaromonas sp. P1(28)-13]|nr:tripartite tricarboxylate transporter substrate binding protein [Polaromonas sp. P2-4]UUZ74995.1 tripartite tricarboxylate transporter substrate binding protein [Polaromonas sp. P1(28)-13]